MWAFAKCTNLESVILDGVNEIYKYAFGCCDSLEEFVFYENIKNLEENNIFKGISEKQQIKITCPKKNIDYFKERFLKSEINNDNHYVLK